MNRCKKYSPENENMPKNMSHYSIYTLVVLCASMPMSASHAGDDSKNKVPPDHAAKMQAGVKIFKESVREVFIKNCLDCHGGRRTRADFNLASREALIASKSLGKNAESSKLFQVIAHQREPFMPHKADKLPEKTISAIAKWIELGAPYDRPLVEAAANNDKEKPPVTDADRQFWSFRRLQVQAVPKDANDSWSRTPIDQFIQAKLRQEKLRGNDVASRPVLIRRAYFDLLGLPPSPEEVAAFVNDPDPLAYEKLVDRLLESPHYGERWARHWMDVARFAESHGYEQDYTRPHAYHYRDFLIKAFNQDMPYDQFVRWQLAGDELNGDNPLAMMATGFLGGGSFPTQLTEAEFESARYDELDDMVSTVGTAFLGLTIGCARCHDHKYDPIPTKDYYRLASTFTTTIRSEVDLVLEKGQKPVKVQVTSEGVKPMRHHADGRGFPHFYPMTFFLKRGDVHQKQGEAPQGFLQVLMRTDKDVTDWKIEPPEKAKTSFRRTALANWITDTREGGGHILARVMVNRVWQHHFGKGIVATPNDFGLQGDAPTHPELLEWLAVDFVHNGWKIKRLHKLIMTSAVYIQSSASDEKRSKIDVGNRYYWRWEPRRLEAEPIRDTMLAVAGMLDKTMYGPGTLDQNMRRRSVYFLIKRSELIPMMMLFDWPEHLVSIGRRSVTTTAPQALMFMNSPQARSYAEGFAKRILQEPAEKRLQRAYQLAFGREVMDREVQALTAFLEKQKNTYQSQGRGNAEQLAWTDLCQTLMSMNEFIYIP